ncbi:sensor histidine kinase [Shewanella maritima]|uniref:sensor histidine kinase n=1 Tax=Shewanella maritima TaxID=2520507 RepID=UPI003736DC13
MEQLNMQISQQLVNQDTANNPQIPSYKTKTAWIYLVYLVFFFVPLYFQQGQWLNISVSLTMLIPFLISYFWVFTCHSSKAKYPLAIMIITAACTTPFTSGSLSFFSFASFFIGFHYPKKTAIMSIVALSGVMFILDFALSFPSHYFAFYGSAISIAMGIFGSLERNRTHLQRQQQRSQDEISQLATSLERERIARDLHDIVGHQLASIALKAELADKLLAKGNTEQAQAQIAQVSDITRECLTEVRQAVSGYKHIGLNKALHSVSQLLRDKSIVVTLEGQPPKMPKLVESQLALIITELGNNILKHSQTTHCVINNDVGADYYQLTVTENVASLPFDAGNGLTGIKERADIINAKLSIDTQPQVQISLRIALEQ